MEANDRRLYRHALKPALILAAIYILVSLLWIAFSDALAARWFEGTALTRAQTFKGWFFVAVSGLLIFALAVRLNRSLLKTESLEKLVHYDPATGLANKLLFLPMLNNAIEQAAGEESRVGVLHVQLRDPGGINQILRQDASDRIATLVAQRFQPQIRQSDMLARLDRQSFAILMQEPVNPDRIAVLADTLLSALKPPVQIDGVEFSVRASIGISIYPEDGETAQRLLHSAALAAAKAQRKPNADLEFYTSGLTEIAYERFRLETRLRNAAEENRLTVCYQPQIDLRTRAIIGAEALVRWRDEEFGQISPAVFIPLAEEAGLIGRITRSVMNQALGMLGALEDGLEQGLRIAVNVSGAEIATGELASLVPALAREHEIPLSAIELEVTETAAMEDPETTDQVLRSLRSAGIRVALDDFGTGYSSLVQLRRFQLDMLKIDRQFVAGVDRDANNAGICRAVIAMAHSMGLKVLAEGVETEAEEEALREMGCDYAQGYLFDRPLPAAEFANRLRRQNRRREYTGSNIRHFPGA